MADQQAIARSTAPIVSVCIANYNGASMLRECIESVLNQSAGSELQIIVHDDASTDDSLQLIHDEFPQVELIASDVNAGYCIANNRMVARARGEFVLLLNNDAALKPDAVATLLQQATDGCRDAILTLPQYDWKSSRLVDRGCLLDPFYNPVPSLDPGREDVAYVIGACLWVPRALWHALGGFPEWMESIGEDLYLCCAARLIGVPVRAVPSSGYLHRQGASFGGNRADAVGLRSSRRRRRLSERNKIAALAVLTPSPLAWILLAMHLPLLMLEGALVSVANRDASLWRDVYFRSITGAWTLRDEIRTERHRIQSVRKTSLVRYLASFTPWPRKLVLLCRFGFPRID